MEGNQVKLVRTVAHEQETFSTRRYEPGPSNELVTEDSAALSFLEENHGRLAYCSDEGTWLVWTGFYWRRDRTGLAFEWVRQHVRNLVSGGRMDLRLRTERTGFASGVEKFSRSAQEFATEAADWDADPYLLGTPTGTVNLRTGELNRSRPEDRITRVTAIAPDAAADCPVW